MIRKVSWIFKLFTIISRTSHHIDCVLQSQGREHSNCADWEIKISFFIDDECKVCRSKEMLLNSCRARRISSFLFSVSQSALSGRLSPLPISLLSLINIHTTPPWEVLGLCTIQGMWRDLPPSRNVNDRQTLPRFGLYHCLWDDTYVENPERSVWYVFGLLKKQSPLNTSLFWVICDDLCSDNLALTVIFDIDEELRCSKEF